MKSTAPTIRASCFIDSVPEALPNLDGTIVASCQVHGAPFEVRLIFDPVDDSTPELSLNEADFIPCDVADLDTLIAALAGMRDALVRERPRMRAKARAFDRQLTSLLRGAAASAPDAGAPFSVRQELASPEQAFA
jgi:hypothetical protein